MLGFASGLPLALSGSTLSVWMRQAGIDLGTIGLFTLVGTPYTLKFLWAPLVDALDVPVLSRLLGRRRGWLVFAQILLMIAIVLLALCNPKISPWYLVFGAALLVATASATQDIVIDAFRVESLDTSEQAAGMASYVAAYRVGMLVSTAGALYVVSGFEWAGFGTDAAWSLGYVVMAALVVLGIDHLDSRHRAGALGRGACRARQTCRRASVHACGESRHQCVFRVSHPRCGHRRAGLRGAVQILRRLCRRHDNALCHRSRLQPHRLCQYREGCRPRRRC